MKALIRHEGETILSDSNVDGIDWTTGAPLTNPSWAGGAYAICESCPVSDPEPGDFDISEVAVPVGEPTEDEEQTIIRRVAVFVRERYDIRKQEVDE